MAKPKKRYHVTYSANGVRGAMDTMAVSEEQAVNNARYRAAWPNGRVFRLIDVEVID